jgi:hypothetical protein
MNDATRSIVAWGPEKKAGLERTEAQLSTCTIEHVLPFPFDKFALPASSCDEIARYAMEMAEAIAFPAKVRLGCIIERVLVATCTPFLQGDSVEINVFIIYLNKAHVVADVCDKKI